MPAEGACALRAHVVADFFVEKDHNHRAVAGDVKPTSVVLVSVISLSVGKRILVNILHVVKRTTTTVQITQNMASSTDHGDFWSWVQIPPSIIMKPFSDFPNVEFEKYSPPVYLGNETALILTGPPAYPADLIVSPNFRERGRFMRISLGKLLLVS